MNFAGEIIGIFRERTCVMGVGNTLRGDDAVGVYIARELERGLRCSNLNFIIAEDIPESYTFHVAEMDCDCVLILDSVQAGMEPGAIVFGPLDQSKDYMNDCSTHRLSLGLAADVWSRYGKKCYLLGVQAGNTDYCDDLTGGVRETADMLIETITAGMRNTPEGVCV